MQVTTILMVSRCQVSRFQSLLYYRNGGQFFLAGELNKAVPMSPRRVRSISVSTEGTRVQLVGSPGELVPFDLCYVAGGGGGSTLRWRSQAWRLRSQDVAVRCHTVNCTIADSGLATLSVAQSVCY